MKLNLPPDEYYAQLAKVPTSGGALFRNSKGEFLIVKPTYKNYYEIPGGMSESNETATMTVIREVKEELGLSIKNPRVFCIDFQINKPFARILFLFDGGILSEDEIRAIKLDTDELSEYKFVGLEKMIELVGEKLRKRLTHSIESLYQGTITYLEDNVTSLRQQSQ